LLTFDWLVLLLLLLLLLPFSVFAYLAYYSEIIAEISNCQLFVHKSENGCADALFSSEAGVAYSSMNVVSWTSCQI